VARRQQPAHPQPALRARRPEDVLTESYPESEYWEDLLRVTAGRTNETLARMALRESAQCDRG
jgi:hypothetical protein